MGIPCKEELICLETWARMQTQIYPDSADFGIKLHDSNKAAIRGALKELMDFYGYTVEKSELWSHIKVCMPIEYDEVPYLSCMVLHFDWCKDLVKKFEFVSIHFTRELLTAKEAKAKYNINGLN